MAAVGNKSEHPIPSDKCLLLRHCRQFWVSLASDEASYVTGSVLMGGRQLAGVPKLALDFLLRPATMTSRQHSGTSFL
jgi:hypothetical protein